MYLDDQPNSIDCEGRKVFLAAIRMFKSSNKVRTQHTAVAQKELVLVGKKGHQGYE